LKPTTLSMISARGQHQDRHVQALPPQFAAYLEPILPG